jgi:hypothetical protein
MTDQWTTPWFPGNVRPVRVGVYERRQPSKWCSTQYSYWDGQHWGGSHSMPSDAYDYGRHSASLMQSVAWRGLTKEAR